MQAKVLIDQENDGRFGYPKFEDDYCAMGKTNSATFDAKKRTRREGMWRKRKEEQGSVIIASRLLLRVSLAALLPAHGDYQ